MTSIIRGLSFKFSKNVVNSFREYYLLHVAAVILTFVLVLSGFDWFYFESTRGETLRLILFPAAVSGFLIPIALPICLYAAGVRRKNEDLMRMAFAIGQAALIALLVSFFYKALTGRVHPELMLQTNFEDISRVFRFGFFRGGVFWGWPSSHTTVAFAMSVALFRLYPRGLIRHSALVYALYVGISVSATIHWFSDFVAGACIGIAIGYAVGSTFSRVQTTSKDSVLNDTQTVRRYE